MSTITCDIVTPERKLFSEDAYMVVAPGVEGEMGFLEDHAPLVSVLSDGIVRVMSDAATVAHRFALQGGYVQVTGKKVIVLADRAVPVEDIDVTAVHEEASALESKIAALKEDDPGASMLKLDLDWCHVREHAVEMKSK